MTTDRWQLFAAVRENTSTARVRLDSVPEADRDLFHRILAVEVATTEGDVPLDALRAIEDALATDPEGDVFRPWTRVLLAEHLFVRMDVSCLAVAQEALASIPDDPLLSPFVVQARARLHNLLALASLAVPGSATDIEYRASLADFRRCGLENDAAVATVFYLIQRAVIVGDGTAATLNRVREARDILVQRGSARWFFGEGGLAFLHLLRNETDELAVVVDRCRNRGVLVPHVQHDWFERLFLAPLTAVCQLASRPDDPAPHVCLQRWMDEIRRDMPWMAGLLLNLVAEVYADQGDSTSARMFFDRADPMPAFGWTDDNYRRRLALRLDLLDGSVDAVGAIKDEVNALASSGRSPAALVFARKAARDCDRRGRVDDADLLRSLADDHDDGALDDARTPGMPKPQPPAGTSRLSASEYRAAPRVVVRLLAPEVYVTIDGRPVTLARNTARLLTILLTTTSPVTVDQLVDRLWPDTGLVAGRKRLATSLYRLRARLGLGALDLVHRRDNVIRVEPPADWRVDWSTFHTAMATNDPEAQAAALAAVDGALASAQFAYDDAFTDVRHHFVASWTEHARRLHRQGVLDVEDLRAAAAALDLDPAVLAL